MKKILYICITALIVAGCKKNDNRGPQLDVNASVTIASFNVGNIIGSIDNETDSIKLVFPFGSDRTQVRPDIKLPVGAGINPGSGVATNLINPVNYRVINGNIYRDYTVVSTEEKAIESFVVGGVTATIDEVSRTIKALVPVGVNITAAKPVITLVSGASITPASESTVDFTSPVTFTVTKGNASVQYTVTITSPKSVAFLGTAVTADGIVNNDEKAAWTWLQTNYPDAVYVSFNGIQNGTAFLEKYKALWWHFDSSQDLPSIANDANVIKALQSYYKVGGNLFLSGFAIRYVEALGIVPAGKGPNEYFGLGAAFIDGAPWGISYKGNESHPAFAGLPLATDRSFATTYLIGGGAWRLNHFAQWHTGTDWGGYNSPAGFRDQTGGVDLAGADNDEFRNTSVNMAEWVATSAHGTAIAFGSGSYDWYSEANPANTNDRPVNSDLPNIYRITQNILNYLIK